MRRRGKNLEGEQEGGEK